MLAGYCASKAGVNALFDALRIELPPLGIAVTTICHGWIQTPMTANLRLPPNEVTSVEKAAKIIEVLGDHVATPAEARQILGLGANRL